MTVKGQIKVTYFQVVVNGASVAIDTPHDLICGNEAAAEGGVRARGK